jgi:hypothetical protein
MKPLRPPPPPDPVSIEEAASRRVQKRVRNIGIVCIGVASLVVAGSIVAVAWQLSGSVAWALVGFSGAVPIAVAWLVFLVRLWVTIVARVAEDYRSHLRTVPPRE